MLTADELTMIRIEAERFGGYCSAEFYVPQLLDHIDALETWAMNDWQGLQDAIGQWADGVFGSRFGSPHGIIEHLSREVEELRAEPFASEEYADMLMLVMDAARNAGFDMTALYGATWRKLEVNRARQWGTPDEHGIIEHVRAGEPGSGASDGR